MPTTIDIALVGPDAPRRRSPLPRVDGAAITILNGFARRYAAHEPRGGFSVKWIPRGAARYTVDGVQHRLAGDKVLLLHEGEAYDVDFIDPRGSESFCLFFSPSLLAEALEGTRLTPGADSIFRPPAAVQLALHDLHRAVAAGEPPARALEERLLLLLDAFAAISVDHHRRADVLPARRPATRRSLFVRLQRAREMIEDTSGRPPPLEAIARACGLSKFHLLRLFTAAFDLPPMAYAAQVRTARARDLLRLTQSPVGQIAERLGYADQGTFARSFRRATGVTPSAFRRG